MLLSCIFCSKEILFLKCSFSSEIFFVVDKVAVDCFKDDIILSHKEKYKIKLYQDVTLNHMREKGKPRCKLSYKVFEKQYVHDPFIYTHIYFKH